MPYPDPHPSKNDIAMNSTPDPKLPGQIIRPRKSPCERISSWFSSRIGQLQGALVTGGVMVVLWLFSAILQYNLYKNENAVLKQDVRAKTTKVQELEHTILSLKADLNISTIEKASAENRAAVADLIPLQALSIVSNLDNLIATEPTNRQQLLSLLHRVEALTNALTEATAIPTFDLYVNDVKITNMTCLNLKQSRTMNVSIKNTSPMTAEQVCAEFEANSILDPTNVYAPEWTHLDAGRTAYAGRIGGTRTPDNITETASNTWISRSNRLVPGNTDKKTFCGLGYIRISTSWPCDEMSRHLPVCPVRFVVYAAGTRAVSYLVILAF